MCCDVNACVCASGWNFNCLLSAYTTHPCHTVSFSPLPPHTSPSLPTPLVSPSLPTPLTLQEEGTILDAEREEVCNLLQALGNEANACESVQDLQKLRCTLVGALSDISSRYNHSCALGRKRSVNTKDIPSPKKQVQLHHCAQHLQM